MFILAGQKKMFSKKGESINDMRCDHCGRVGKWDYSATRTWATAFFVPTAPIPFTKEEWFLCPNCRYGVQINDENREKYMAMIRLKNEQVTGSEEKIETHESHSYTHENGSGSHNTNNNTTQKTGKKLRSGGINYDYSQQTTTSFHQESNFSRTTSQQTQFSQNSMNSTQEKFATGNNGFQSKEPQGRALGIKYNEEGLAFYNKGDYTHALNSFLTALQICPDDAIMVRNAGSAYRCLNDFDNAKRYYEKAGAMGDANAYAFIGHLYFPKTFPEWTVKRIDSPQIAASWFKLAIDLCKENETQQIGVWLNNIGVCYEDLQIYGKAAAYYWTAFSYGCFINETGYQKLKNRLDNETITRIESIQNRNDLNTFLQA